MGLQRKTGTIKQAKDHIDKQKLLKQQLESVCDITDEKKSFVNSKIVKIIDNEIKPALEGKRKEMDELDNQRINKKELQAKTEAIHTEIEDLLAIQNLESLLASHNPYSRSEYAKLLKRQIKINPGQGQEEKLIYFRKNALQILRDILQGFKGGKDLLCPGLTDDFLALLIQFRHKVCLDCKILGYGRDELGPPSPPCAICREPLCKTYQQTIVRVTDTIKDREIQDAKGYHMIQMICSYCRTYGTQMVSRGLLDDSQNTPGTNL